MLTSDKEKKYNISPSTQIFAVRGGKLGIYAVHNALRYSESQPHIESYMSVLSNVLSS